MSEDKLNELIADHSFCLPVTDVSIFLHMGLEALRASMEQNRCPFGFAWKIGERCGYKIPTITFVAWLTKGTFQPTS